MPRKLAIAFVVIIGLVLTIGLPVVGAFIPQKTQPRSYMIIPGRPDWKAEGSILVWEARSGLRTDLLIDPGPYTREDRLRMIGPAADSWLGGGTVPERSAPHWVRTVALDHAGPTFAGWQARVAAFGWPRPVLYWLWDWRTESLRGGAVPTSLKTPATAKTEIPPHALPWRFIWSGLFIDWALFSGGTLLIAFVYIRFRALNRRRRGQCTRCGYNRRGLGPGVLCPECGASFPKPPGNPVETALTPSATDQS